MTCRKGGNVVGHGRFSGEPLENDEYVGFWMGCQFFKLYRLSYRSKVSTPVPF